MHIFRPCLDKAREKFQKDLKKMWEELRLQDTECLYTSVDVELIND